MLAAIKGAVSGLLGSTAAKVGLGAAAAAGTAVWLYARGRSRT